MKKYLFPLFFILFICSFITSCSSIFSDEDEYGTVSFSLNEAAAKAINSRAASSRDASSRAAGQEIFSDCKLSVTLYVNDKEQTQEAELSAEGASVKFERIRVGSKVSARVHVYKGDAVIAAGLSESKKITRGENTLNVKLTYAANGNLTFGEHVILKVVPSEEIWLSKGEFVISLLDENGKDILEDVDWNASHEITWDSANGQQTETIYDNDNLLQVSYTIRKGHTEISSYLAPEKNKRVILETNPLSESGKFEVTFTVLPGSTTYVNKAGKTVPFPSFEPVTTSFEIEVEDIFGINFTGKDSSEISYIVQHVLEDITLHHKTVKFYGVTDASYYYLFGMTTNFLSDGVDLDCSQLTSLSTTKSIDHANNFEGSGLHSLILPKDLENIDNTTFQDCFILESITLPASLISIGSNVFKECTNLTEIIFDDPTGWHRFSSVQTLPIEDWSSGELVDFSDSSICLNLKNTDYGEFGNSYFYHKTE